LIETISPSRDMQLRHESAPLLKEREQYLTHLLQQGSSLADVRTTAAYLVHIVRVIEPSRADPAKVDDIRFIHYQPLAGAWIAAGVEVYADGKKVFTEDYTDIQGNVKLDPGTFDPQKFSSTHWE
jgi:hypothetical protein